MSISLPKGLVFTALFSSVFAAQAGAWLETYAPPNNYHLTGIASNGVAAVSGGTSGNMLFNGQSGSFGAFGGNAPSLGFGGALGISANGATVSGNATAANGFSQAARYDVATQSWATLGSLGAYSTANISDSSLKQQSMAYGISSDGSTVVGQAFYSASAAATSSVAHAVVFKDGQVIDLTPNGASGVGRAFAVSDGGQVVAGTLNAGSATGNTLWQWNGSSYVASTPTINNRLGAAKNIQVAVLSGNGRYGAGGSMNALAVNYAPAGSPFGFTMTYSQATFWDTATNTGKLIPFDITPDFSNPDAVDLLRNNKAVVTGVSNSGLVIGQFSQFFSGTNASTLTADTWIYDNNTGVTKSFDNYLTDLGLGLGADKHVWSLSSMAADGSAIAGVYFDKATGTSSTFILHTAAVPEPATLGLFVLALPLLLRRVAKQRSLAAQH